MADLLTGLLTMRFACIAVSGAEKAPPTMDGARVAHRRAVSIRSMMSTGQRAHERFEHRMAVTMVVGTTSFEGHTENLSLGGMFVRTEARLTIGTALTVEFQLPANKAPSVCNASVRWLRDGGVGLQFGRLRAKDVWALNQLFRRGSVASVDDA